VLTLEEKATNFDTMRHIERVRNLLDDFIVELLNRGRLHDQTKLESPEVELFTKYTPALAATTFGSPEYNENKKKLGSALAHHYAKNRHHPEHHPKGVRGMNLVDLVEMFVDWKAASERHHDGNLLKSIEKNSEHFNIGPELREILENTAEMFDNGH